MFEAIYVARKLFLPWVVPLQLHMRNGVEDGAKAVSRYGGVQSDPLEGFEHGGGVNVTAGVGLRDEHPAVARFINHEGFE